MTRLFIYILFCTFSLNTFSQTVIKGNVSQEKGGTLAGANVYIQDSYDGGSTNENGIFRFKTSKTGQATLIVGFMGYEQVSRKVELKGDTIHLNVSLKEVFNQMNAVTITAGTFEAGDKRQAITITPLDMMTTAGAVGDVYGALQSLPGTSTNGESGRLFVKGGDSNESQTYIDGSLVYVPYNSSVPNLSTRGRFNPFMFKGTIFSTGGYSAEYGQALSSVLLLSTNDMPADDQLDLSLLSVGAEVAGTKLWKNGAITGSFTYNNLAPYMGVVSQNYHWIHPPEYGTGAVSIRQKTGKTGMLKFYTSISKSNLIVDHANPDALNTLSNYNLSNDNYFMNCSWNGRVGEKLAMNTAASFTNNRDRIVFDTTSVDQKTTGIHLKEVLSYPFNDKFTLKLGGELFSKTFSQDAIFPSAFHFNSFTNHEYSGFAEAQIYASSKFITRIGARIENSDYLKGSKLSPRLSAAYKVSENSQFSLAYGWFYQNPQDDFLLFTHQLTAERADHYILSYQSSINQRTLRIELYHKEYKDLVKTNNGAIYLPSTYSNQGYGYARGLDLFWRDNKTIKNGDYWISYSYLDTRRNYENFPKEAVPGFASTHNLAIVYKHWLSGLRSLVSLNFKYSSPRVYNDPNSPVFNGAKMLPYKSLDLSWSFLYRKNVIIYGAVTNTLGFKNEFGRQYATTPDSGGNYPAIAITPQSSRFFVIACFITLTKKGNANQLDKIE